MASTPAALALFVLHFIIDALKARYLIVPWLWLDQLLHVLTILITLEIHLMTLNTIYLLLYLAIALGTLLGGYIAFRLALKRETSAIWQQVTEAQERAIGALQAELNTVKDAVTALKAENARLLQHLSLVKKALKQKGFHVTIDGDIIYAPDLSQKQTSRIQRA